MLNIGPMELILVLLVALIFVGPKKLPEMGRTIGRSLRELRKAQDEVRQSLDLGLNEPAKPARSSPSRSKPRAPVAEKDTEAEKTGSETNEAARPPVTGDPGPAAPSPASEETGRTGPAETG